MTKVGKTIYLFNDEGCIHAKEEALVVKTKEKEHKFPYGSVASIVIFGDTSLTTPVIYQCISHNIVIHCISTYGNYRGCFQGMPTGNVVLRKKQFDMIGTDREVHYAKNEIAGKIQNSIWFLSYQAHHNLNKEQIDLSIARLRSYKKDLKMYDDLDDIRLLEARSASEYFSTFDYLIKLDDENMSFIRRSKRPPLNNVNVLLSFFYTMLNALCYSALVTKGLDPECGYLHVLRSGRNSLACDLMEEFRSCTVDHFVITLINRKEVSSSDFEHNVDGIKLANDACCTLIRKWDDYLDNTKVLHKYYNQKFSLRILIYEQAHLLAQFIRGDIEEYPPFLMS